MYDTIYKTVFQTEKSTKVKEKIISNILQHKRSFEIMSVGRTLKSCLSNQNFEHGKMSFLYLFCFLLQGCYNLKKIVQQFLTHKRYNVLINSQNFSFVAVTRLL